MSCPVGFNIPQEGGKPATGLGKLKAVITGGAGFLGSHIVDALMRAGWEVSVIDNLSSGSLRNLMRWINSTGFSFIRGDLKERDGGWRSALQEADVVFHFAANPEVRISTTEPRIHFDENVMATFNVLEAAREEDINTFIFASSSTVYGDPELIPTPEDHPKRPISIYGASKLACEVLLETYHRLYGLRTLSLRYANIIGPRLTHGVIVDFIRKLKADPHELEILGDGTQKKSYLYVSDAVSATLHLLNLMLDGVFSCEAFNVGNEDWVSVVEIADIVAEVMGLSDVKHKFKPMTPDGRGWPGDVKLMLLDISKLKATGWKPTMSSGEAVRRAAEELLLGET